MASANPESLDCAAEVNSFSPALESILPAEVETSLLRALLLEDRAAAASAWAVWRARAGPPRTYFERNATGLKGLLPYVHFALQRNEISTDQAFSIYLRASRLREELRLRIIREVAGESVAALRAHGIDPIFTGGYPIAETAYPEAVLRHCHGLYLHVDDVAEAVRALEPACARTSRPMFIADGVLLKHSCRLPILLSSRLLQMPGEDRVSGPARSAARMARLGSIHARRLGPGHGLLDALAPAVVSVHRLNLRWAIDSMSLIRAEGPSLWEPFLKAAADSSMALPLLHLLTWLKRNLEAPVPSPVLERLTALAKVDPPALEALILVARAGARERFGTILQRLPNPLERLRLARAVLLPRSESLRWKYSNLSVSNSPALYAWHTLSFLGKRLRGPKKLAEELELVPTSAVGTPRR